MKERTLLRGSPPLSIFSINIHHPPTITKYAPPERTPPTNKKVAPVHYESRPKNLAKTQKPHEQNPLQTRPEGFLIYFLQLSTQHSALLFLANCQLPTANSLLFPCLFQEIVVLSFFRETAIMRHK